MKKIFKTCYHPEQLNNFIKTNIISTLTGNIFVPGIMVLAFFEVVPDLILYTWFSFHLIIFTIRIYLRNKVKEKAKTIFFLILSSSLLWAIFAWIAFIYSDGIHMLFAGMTIASLAAGSMTTLGGIPTWFFTYVSVPMISLIGAFLSYNEEIFYLSGFLAFIFLYFLLSNGYRQYLNTIEILNLNKQVSDLLNNTNQGFLSFNKELKIDKSFSSECRKIFNSNDITDLNIAELLFKDDKDNKELFIDGISRAMQTNDNDTKEIFISLLPKEQIINRKSIKIEYKYLNDDRYMLILTDITNTKFLKNKLNEQNKVQNMIVEIASNKNDFIELKESFETFIQNISKVDSVSDRLLQSTKRDLHTFKGIFTQKEMIDISEAIFEIEKQIKNIQANDEIVNIFNKADLVEILHRDIHTVNSILGDDFLNSPKSINVNIESIDEIEEKISLIKNDLDDYSQKNIDNILSEITKLKNISAKQMLIPYIQHINRLSSQFDKNIYDLNIQGDKTLKVPPRFKPFIQSLIHLFNNCVEHGIEDGETRIQKGKYIYGKIKCDFKIIANSFMLEISDDGSGLDAMNIAKSAIKNKIKTQDEINNMNENDIFNLIFLNNVTTKESISPTSGFGVGMNVIQKELEKLDGKVNIQSEKDKGVTFTFLLPLVMSSDKCNLNVNKTQNICDNVSTQIEIYLEDILNIKTTQEKQISSLLIENNYAQIDLYNDFNGSVIIILSDEIIQSMSSILIPDSFSDKDKEWMIQELPNEMINTVVGLSIQNFDSSIKDIRMSPPIDSDNFFLMSKIKESKNKFIKEIITENGKIICAIIEKESK